MEITFSGEGGFGNLPAQMKYISGCGLPCFTSGSELPYTVWLKHENTSG